VQALLDRLVDGINPPTMFAAALLVLAVIVVFRIGRMLLMAGLFGVAAGGVSLGRGHQPSQAGAHAAIGFGVAMATMLVLKVAKGFLMWAIITAAGILGLILVNFGP
jgi:hypothetical protein